MANGRPRVGFWVSEKKWRKFRFEEFVALCQRNGMDLVQVDLDSPVETQGSFDMLLHKVSDMSADDSLQRRWHNLQQLVSDGDMAVVDPLDSVRLLGQRDLQYHFLNTLQHTCGMTTPPWAKLEGGGGSMQASLLRMLAVRFPLVCKPIAAHGKGAHQMCLIFTHGGLSQFLNDPQHRGQSQFVVQEYIPHDGVLYKIFALGESVHIVRRPSLRNFDDSERENIHFHSAAVSKEGVSELNQCTLDSVSLDRQNNLSTEFVSRCDELARATRQRTGLNLFGLDIIVDNRDNREYVIDLNIFPSYDGVADVHQRLYELLRSILIERGRLSQLAGVPEISGHYGNVDVAAFRSRARKPWPEKPPGHPPRPTDNPPSISVRRECAAALQKCLEGVPPCRPEDTTTSGCVSSYSSGAGVNDWSDPPASAALAPTHRRSKKLQLRARSRSGRSPGRCLPSCRAAGGGGVAGASGSSVPSAPASGRQRSTASLAQMANWTRVKQFYGIPKPTSRSTVEQNHH